MIDTKRLSKIRQELEIRQNQLALVRTNMRRSEEERGFILGKIVDLKTEEKELLKGK